MDRGSDHNSGIRIDLGVAFPPEAGRRAGRDARRDRHTAHTLSERVRALS